MKSIELFAGAGGLGMGISRAGFKHLAVVEWDKWSCDTIRENKNRGFPLVLDWTVTEGDVREIDFSSLPNDLDLIAGGPPCQPFSMGGKHRAYNDERDMFPATISAIRKLKPRAFILENVKGLTRPTFAAYYNYILLQLEFPEVVMLHGENWNEHFLRLKRHRETGRSRGNGNLHYNVVPTLVNAADFGVPQKRERIFIVGFRGDEAGQWRFPNPTHSFDALLYAQWVSGDYWEAHQIPKLKRPSVPSGFLDRIERLRRLGAPLFYSRWRTVRDALKGLPEPETSEALLFNNHRLQLGAKRYAGHTGSPLDLPAKTLKAGGHGVPGGENMMVKENGSVRYFSVREAARLQTFPDPYIFHGTWSETMRQLGNAVPVALAQIVATSVLEKLARGRANSLHENPRGCSVGSV